jgi:hypothetical protein
VRGELGLRFYAAAPVVTSDGHTLGTVNVIDRQPRQVTEEQLSALSDLAAEVADVLELKLFALQAVRTERAMARQESARREAAEAMAADLAQAASAERHLQRPPTCQLGGPVPCPNPAEIKIADSWGDSAWGCMDHGEEALFNVPSVFLATESSTGLAAYRDRQRVPEIGPAGAPPG